MKPSRIFQWPAAAVVAWGLLAGASAQAPVTPAAAATPPGSTAGAGSQPALLPAELFYRHADLIDAALSPSGALLAITSGVADGRVGLFVLNLREMSKSTLAARFSDADIRSFNWVSEDRLVFNVIDNSEGSGDQPFAPGLFSVRPNGQELRTLVRLNKPFLTAPSIGREPLAYNHQLLHIPGNQVAGQEHVLVGEIDWDSRGDFRAIHAKRLNIVTGQAVSLAGGAPDNVVDWEFDAKGNPQLVVTRADGRMQVHLRDAAKATWERITDQDGVVPSFRVHSVDGDVLYVLRPDQATGMAVLARFDLRERKMASEPFVATPGFDFIGSLLRERDGGAVMGVRVQTDAETTIWLDAGMKAAQAVVDERLPGRVNRMTCSRCGSPDMVALVKSFSDTDPGQWWVYRPGAAEAQRWQALGSVRKGVSPRQMATVDFHRIKARDGLQLPLWLTVPRGVKPQAAGAGKAAPAVVMVHGGPWVRGGSWGWQPLEQFLASRGYVVIAPEFRGSTGYGTRHFRAGWKQWGQAMQDDVADAVQWAVKEGWVDPQRVCIAGASYGGYATLMGLVRHPELYRCGIAWVAVTDPLLLYAPLWRSDLSEQARRYSMPQLLGDPVKDADMLKAVSPLQQAAKLTRPLFMAFGREDRRVPLEHGELLNKAMRAAGLAPQYVVYEGEGHGWLKLDTRRDFYERTEKFLAEHLR